MMRVCVCVCVSLHCTCTTEEVAFGIMMCIDIHTFSRVVLQNRETDENKIYTVQDKCRQHKRRQCMRLIMRMSRNVVGSSNVKQHWFRYQIWGGGDSTHWHYKHWLNLYLFISFKKTTGLEMCLILEGHNFISLFHKAFFWETCSTEMH